MMNLFEEFFGIIHAFEEHGIRYAVIGGFAMGFHDVIRATKDIDLLILLDDIDAVPPILETLSYRLSGSPLTFNDSRLTLHRYVRFFREEYSMLDLLVGEEETYRDVVMNAEVHDPGNGPVRIARKEDIITLKLMRNSEQDRIDIKRLKGEE